MMRARYLLPVVVGLFLGVAAGWLSNRVTAPSVTHHQAAPARANRIWSNLRRDARTAPRPKDLPPGFENDLDQLLRQQGFQLAPGVARMQRQLARCLYGSFTWQQQVGCLQSVCRHSGNRRTTAPPTADSAHAWPARRRRRTGLCRVVDHNRAGQEVLECAAAVVDQHRR